MARSPKCNLPPCSVDKQPLPSPWQPCEPAAPVVTQNARIIPASGEVGQTFSFNPGSAAGCPTPVAVPTILFNGEEVTLTGGTYTPTEAGTLEFDVEWSNSEGIVSTVTEVEVTEPEPEQVAPTITEQPSITPAVGGVVGDTFTWDFGAATGTPTPTLILDISQNYGVYYIPGSINTDPSEYIDLNGMTEYTPTVLGTFVLNSVWSNGVAPDAIANTIACAIEAPEAEFTRTASTDSTATIHSGHSLTDTYVHLGAEWPGNMRSILQSQGFTQTNANVIKSTIPGADPRWRWNNRVDDMRPTDPTADARRDVSDFDTLVAALSNGMPAIGTADMATLLDYLLRFFANQIENGNSDECVLWSVWPSLNGVGWQPGDPTPAVSFREGLDDFDPLVRYIADYCTAKLKGLYPALPEDWRVWIFPGHKFMARVYDDIQAGTLPGYTDIQDLYALKGDPANPEDDDAHPSPTLGYGVSCFVTTCQYQLDLAALNDTDPVYIMPEVEVSETQPFGYPAVSPALAEYFWQISWEIATDYAAVGMGGTTGAEPMWEAGDDDPLPDWDPAVIHNAAPAITEQPAITPATAEVGDTLTVTTGTASGVPAPHPTVAAEFNGDPVDVSSGSYTPIEAGELSVSVTWSNGEGADAVSDLATATVAAVDPDPEPAEEPDYLVLETPTESEGVPISGTLPALADDVRNFVGGERVTWAMNGATEFYAIIGLEITSDLDSVIRPVFDFTVSGDNPDFDGPIRLERNGYTYSGKFWVSHNTGDGTSADLGEIQIGEGAPRHAIVEVWGDSTGIYGRRDGGAEVHISTVSAIEAIEYVRLFPQTGDGQEANVVHFAVAAGTTTEDERAAAYTHALDSFAVKGW